jgi:hypothetical protein
MLSRIENKMDITHCLENHAFACIQSNGNFWYSLDHVMVVQYIQLGTEANLAHGFIVPDEPGLDSGPFQSNHESTGHVARS